MKEFLIIAAVAAVLITLSVYASVEVYEFLTFNPHGHH